jgi:SAM-dependent methyltransferase
MNWKLKAHTLAVLSRLPGGKGMYHRLQTLAGTNRLDASGAIDRALDIVELIKQAGGDVQDATCMEIGTGWRPFIPFVLSLLGARRVITLDVNPWLNKRYAFETFQALGKHLESVADRTGAVLDSLHQRYLGSAPSEHTLDALLAGLRVEYVYPGDATDTGIPDGTVDLVVSSNVLEHIAVETLRRIQDESYRILKPGGLAVHRFGPADHFALVDPSITRANFLQFSARQWKWYGGSGLAYHNRLRCVQYDRLFSEAGFDTVTRRVYTDERSIQAIQTGRLHVHPEFAGFTPQELAEDHMSVACRKPG